MPSASKIGPPTSPKDDNVFNQTFTLGPDQVSHLNACVGNNGLVDQRTYGDGYSEAVDILTSALLGNSDGATLDALIYPICFCARHHLELFLKKQIPVIQHIRNLPETAPLSSTHDLGDLWDRLEGVTELTDRRFHEGIKKMKGYFSDFAQIDPTGQTFRYPYNTESQKHLVKTPLINVYTFRTRYLELLKLTEDFELLTDFIEEEYRCETKTSVLSRYDISVIASRLPSYSDWRLPVLKEKKTELMTEFGISSNDFCKALNVIKLHREFSMKIGREIPLVEITNDSFTKLNCIADKVLPTSALTETEWAAIHAVLDIGTSQHYSEHYEFLKNYHLSNFDWQYLEFVGVKNLLRNKDRILTGLKKLGQSSLVNHLAMNIDFSEALAKIETNELEKTQKMRSAGISIFDK